MVAVSVDNDFARFGAKSYAINKINSVEVRERSPHSQNAALALGLLAVICLLSSFGESTTSRILWAVLFSGLAYWQWRRAKIREYLLFLMTSSSETQAFVTRDHDEVMTLRHQIEAAMTIHSRGGQRI